MAFKFEKLDVWKLSLDYVDLIYDLSEQLPKHEQFNLRSQIRRAATSVSLNIAEGSTGQSDKEQSRFLGMALRSLMETVACLHLIYRRGYLEDREPLRDAYRSAENLAIKIQRMRRIITPNPTYLKEETVTYKVKTPTPFDEIPTPSSVVAPQALSSVVVASNHDN